MKFEEEGLFIGLVKFDFHIDGGRLFKGIFEKFFELQHRKYYLKELNRPGPDSSLYTPKAYRMFGSHGLAILSLIDEYAFCSRIFNAGHIQVNGRNKKIKGLNQYKTVVLTGSSECFVNDDKPYLRTRAEDSFLRGPESEIGHRERYPFIGIIRIKLDFKYLREYGIAFPRSTKKYINGLKDCVGDGHPLDCIVVDTYDNDELMVVAFSDSIHTLDAFMKRIRMATLRDVWEAAHPGTKEGKPSEKKGVRHVCSSCHMSYGYDIGFSFQEKTEGFYPWDKEEDCACYSVNCLVESKPGHRHELFEYMNTWHSKNGERLAEGEGDLSFRRTVTGGSILHIPIPIKKFAILHELTPEEDLRIHARRIKLTLNCSRESEGEKCRKHPKRKTAATEISTDFIEDIKVVLKDLGISKIVRERLLSLLDLYNDCARNHLQTYYFMRLHPSVENLLYILRDFQANEDESLVTIEHKLNEEINSLETAFYNRMHNKMTPNTVLEYGGGIQQFLQAFGFAYKELIRLLSPDQAATNYSLIAGVSKESSMRTHTELNINHIIYPQLFCVTSWKEASNCTMHLFADKGRLINPETGEPFIVQKYYDYFRHFIENKEAFDSILDLLLNQTDLVRTDPVYQSLHSVMTPEILKYSLQDYIVYHFAFQRDFGLMWRCYLKVFLQTPSVYRRRGKVSRKQFIFFLLRLLLVAYREKNEDRSAQIRKIIEEQAKEPFDYLLSDLWFECFDKVNDAAAEMCRNLQSYSYVHVSEHLVMFTEKYHLISRDECSAAYLIRAFGDKTVPLEKDELGLIMFRLDTILEARKKKIDGMVAQMVEEHLDSVEVAEDILSPDNVICLMNAFLRTIDRLDQGEKGHPILLHSVPRRPEDGDVDFDAVRKLSSVSARLLADPIGGFIVPDPKVRMEYYAYRTLLYRTLWDWSYRSRASVYQEPKAV